MAVKKSELYSSLWASCDALRGGMDASQYKDYILTLLFVKYVSDKFTGEDYADVEVPEGGSFDDKGLTVKRFMMAQHSYNYYLSKHFSGLSYWYNKCMLCLLRLTLFITTDWSWKDKWRAYLVVFKSK